MKYTRIDDIGDMECATAIACEDKCYGLLRVGDVEAFDGTALCGTVAQAQRLLDGMVAKYRKGLTQQTAWGDYVRDRFLIVDNSQIESTRKGI